MIKLVKENIERIAADEAAAMKLELEGYERMSGAEATSNTAGYTEKKLSEMTVGELKALAKENKVAVRGSLKKSDLIKILGGNENDGIGKAEGADKGE